MKKIITFYDDIFQYHFNRLKDKESNPVVTPLYIISLIQTTHVLVFYILLYFLYDLSGYLSVQLTGVIIYLIIGGFNFYVYIIKKRKNKILQRKKVLTKGFVKLQNIVLYLSMLFPFIVILFFKEILNY